jgi:hypothetical protein
MEMHLLHSFWLLVGAIYHCAGVAPVLSGDDWQAQSALSRLMRLNCGQMYGLGVFTLVSQTLFLSQIAYDPQAAFMVGPIAIPAILKVVGITIVFFLISYCAGHGAFPMPGEDLTTGSSPSKSSLRQRALGPVGSTRRRVIVGLILAVFMVATLGYIGAGIVLHY